MTATSPSESFAGDAAADAAWKRLEPADRMRLRRLVRTGRRIDDPVLTPVVGAYARYQLSRLWVRFFWLWYVPGVVIALGAASQIHPVAVGAVIALGAQAAWARFNLARFARADPA